MPREGKLSRLYPYYCGSVRFNEDTLPPALPTHLAECLRRAGAWDITVEDNRVTWRSSTIRTILDVPLFGRGDLEVTKGSRSAPYPSSTAPKQTIQRFAEMMIAAFIDR